MSTVRSLYSMAMVFSALYDVGTETRKQEIREAWKQSANLPRKKKKQRRKELLLDWAIANWDPFE